MKAIYDAFLAGDRETIDARISPDATLWDAFHEPLLRYGDERPPAPAEHPADLRPSDPVIDVFGDVALVRHLLTVVYEDRPEQRVRNTSVWRRVDGRWMCVHNHEDLVA
jgi:ketosteroid isomerase-like protein